MKFYNCDGSLVRRVASGEYEAWLGNRWSGFRDAAGIVSRSNEVGEEFAVDLLRGITLNSEYPYLSREEARQKLYQPL